MACTGFFLTGLVFVTGVVLCLPAGSVSTHDNYDITEYRTCLSGGVSGLLLYDNDAILPNKFMRTRKI